MNNLPGSALRRLARGAADREEYWGYFERTQGLARGCPDVEAIRLFMSGP